MMDERLGRSRGRRTESCSPCSCTGNREPQSLRLVPEEQDPGLGRSGWVAVVDTVTGEVRRIEPETSWRPEAATFSPDGQRLAVQDEAGALGVVDLADRSMTDLGSPDLFLTSDDGWSPDGALLLGMQRSASGLADDLGCVAFVSLGTAPAPGCLEADRYGPSSLLGWTGAQSVAIAVARGAADGEVDTVDVLGVDVSDGSARSITSIPTRGGDAPAFMVDVARDALQAGRVSAAPGTDRGSWP